MHSNTNCLSYSLRVTGLPQASPNTLKLVFFLSLFISRRLASTLAPIVFGNCLFLRTHTHIAALIHSLSSALVFVWAHKHYLEKIGFGRTSRSCEPSAATFGRSPFALLFAAAAAATELRKTIIIIIHCGEKIDGGNLNAIVIHSSVTKGKKRYPSLAAFQTTFC